LSCDGGFAESDDKFDDLEQKERKQKDRDSIINPLGSLYNDIFGD
jgi:hypothetical protein